MSAAPARICLAGETVAQYGAPLAPPRLELRPYTRAELWERFRGGERDADDCERWLATAARARAALDLAIAEGLAALRAGDRLAQLGFRLGDYAREVLGIEERTASGLVRLARELRVRPRLRAALRAGRVRLRAAQVILPVAIGDAEAFWVERASRETVRAMEKLVAAARAGVDASEADDEWGRVEVRCTPEERAVVDAALEVAGREVPGSSRFERLEAIAQEYLGELPEHADELQEPAPGAARAGRPVPGGIFHRRPVEARRERREAELEAENERWSHLAEVPEAAAPELDFPAHLSADEVDARLRALARTQRDWDEVVGHCALIVRRARLHELLGFASFRHYVEERLGLPARAVEQRAALEEQLWQSPALREARRQGLSYEKLRALARLPEAERAALVPRARATTCVALRRELDEKREGQMRAGGKLSAPAPARVGWLLAAAIRTVRVRVGHPLPAGKCLAIVAAHFLSVWGMPAPRRTVSQRIRERDGEVCSVPGCSHAATDAHHVLFRSHGGHGTAPWNQTAVCEFHHHRCIHAGFLKVRGRAPDRLVWTLRGRPFTGGVE